MLHSACAINVGRLFFPQHQALGLRPDETLSPALLKKVVYSGTRAVSFAQASRDVEELAEQAISDQRVRRATVKIGDERVAERDAAVGQYQQMPLPQRRQSPVEHIPGAVSIEMDGGRMQVRDRQTPEPGEAVEEGGRKGRFWRETKVGVLQTLATQTHVTDPCPTVPEIFVDQNRVQRLCREIKGAAKAELPKLSVPDEVSNNSASASASESTPSSSDDELPNDRSKKRPGLPVPLVRSVVATRRNIEAFGWMLACAAWSRGFAAAVRKAFLGDGSESNWSVWRKHFSDYTPILDFVHALCYVYAAAIAGRTIEAAWDDYCRWAQWLWSGEVSKVIAAMEVRQLELGLPTDTESEDSARKTLATTLGYLRNQQSRMKYAEYRQQGLPITTSHVESTIKQIGRRVKGTEKFWSVGGEAILQLFSDLISDTRPLDRFWHNRQHNATGQREYHMAS
jgi:hypothetical protein